MKKVNQKAKKELDRLAALAEAGEGTGMQGYAKLHLGGRMDLVVEEVGSAKFGSAEGVYVPLYSFAHYGEMNGDAMRDPDVVLFRGPDGNWYPVSYRNDYVGAFDEVLAFEDGNVKFRARGMADLASFVGSWAANLKEYKAALVTPTKASLEFAAAF